MLEGSYNVLEAAISMQITLIAELSRAQRSTMGKKIW